MKVIFCPTGTPTWAIDPRFEDLGRRASLAPAIGDATVRQAFADLATFLATQFPEQDRYFEVWNEPNTAGTFYPQTLPNDAAFAARTYLKMLKAFYAAAKRSDPQAVVIAGATAPRGGNDVDSTSPQRFAGYLRRWRAQRYFDAYSHHPYPWREPEAVPGDKRRTVWLGNLSALTGLFPGKPFFLTEYGYATQRPTLIGRVVSEATQARYLTEAYKYVAKRYPQVRALLWFMVEDLKPAPDRLGAYMGLRTTNGVRKQAWFAFSRHTSVTVQVSRVAGAAKRLRLSGTLSNANLGVLGGRKVVLQMRARGAKTWRTVSTRTTGPGGGYGFTVGRSLPTRYYRVVWTGVCTSRRIVASNRQAR